MNSIIQILIYLVAIALGVQAFIGLGFLVSSIWEREKRASLMGAVQFLGMLAVLILFLIIARRGGFDTGIGKTALILGCLMGGAGVYFLTHRSGSNQKALKGSAGYVVGNASRVDERTIVFARNKLRPGTDPYKTFYQDHPELEAIDTGRRAKGKTLGKYGSIDAPDEKPNVGAMLSLRQFSSNQTKPEIYKPQQAASLKGHKEVMSPEEASARVKGYTKHLGADLVGIARIDPLWVYSHRGNMYGRNWDTQQDIDWAAWGAEIKTEHKFAVVFAEEMDRELIDSSPHSPVFVESMRNYAKGTYISTLLAGYIANLGYSAEANFVQHYNFILPPLAVDAGLGEVGRLGYLMTKEFGPRIRLSAVSTDLPLIPDKPVDIGAEDFCRICKKCATCCPSKSIPEDDEMKAFNGSLRWKLDAESCFRYWSKVGTDCCICMHVCPWSHARTWPHRIIVRLISRNKWSRRIFNVMDDIFYGRKPKPKLPPEWASYRGNHQ